MDYASKIWLMKIFAYIPMCLLFGLFTFFYLCYLEIYLLKLLTGTYGTDTNPQANQAQQPAALIAMKTMTQFMNQFVADVFDANEEHEKGVVYAILIHIFIGFFMVSALRVILVNPGKVTDDWNAETEKELNKAIESEKRILRNIRKKTKLQQIRQNTANRILKDQSYNLVDVSRDTLTDQRNSNISDGANLLENDETHDMLGSQQRNTNVEESQEVQGQGGEHTPDMHFGVENNEEDDVKAETLMNRTKFFKEYDGTNIETEDLTQEKIHHYAVMSALKQGDKRFCGHCQKFKPERSHHCRQCGRCVLKMDHHCPWVNNCVGFFNYKFFLNMLFWADVSLIFISVTFTEVIQDSLLSTQIGWGALYFYLVVYIMAVAMSVILLLFLSFHIWLISNGKTTLEHCEKKDNTKKGWNKGMFRNLLDILGPNFLIWCIPICPNTEGNGLKF
mmetsp:Transcript_18691/g.21486  ORF Transcript_18691/g.21486 Transcript_18691/m.21486 type:complete len:448 (+) Transcript_18691:53-1396(+)